MSSGGKAIFVRGVSFCMGTCLLEHNAAALDWPQWRGANRDGVPAETGWSTNWPKEGLKQLWKAEIGTDSASSKNSPRKMAAKSQTVVSRRRSAPPVRPDFIVATNGSDAWSGRIETQASDGKGGPFLPPARAQPAVRALRQALPDRRREILVQVRDGLYPLTAPLRFTPENLR